MHYTHTLFKPFNGKHIMKTLIYLCCLILLISTVGCGELTLEEDDTTGTATDTTGTATDTTEVVTEEMKMILRANKTCEEKTADQPLGQELADAVFEKNLPEVKRLVAAGANINYRDTDRGGKTPLMLARPTAYVTALIAAEGLCINLIDADKKTALMHILAATSPLFPEKILEIAKVPGINPNIKDKNGNTAIFLALRIRAWFVVESIFGIGGVDMQVVNKKGNTVLHELVSHKTQLANKGDVDKVFALVGAEQEDINTFNNADMTPLMIAAYNLRAGETDLERLLKLPNIDINKQNSKGNTALHFSVQKSTNPHGPNNLTHFKGIQINLCNNDGKTARTLLQERIAKIKIKDQEIVTIEAEIVTIEAAITTLEAEIVATQDAVEIAKKRTEIAKKRTEIKNKRKEIGEFFSRFTVGRREGMDAAFWRCYGREVCGIEMCECGDDAPQCGIISP